MTDTAENLNSAGSGKVFKAVNPASEIKFISPSALNKAGVTGIVLEGTYLSSEEKPGLDNKIQTNYLFELEDGSRAVLNGCNSIDRQMASVAAGELTQIEYTGKVKIKGGKTAHNFTVRTASSEE